MGGWNNCYDETGKRMNNIPKHIEAKIGMDLHKKVNHPLEILKNKIYEYFGDEFKREESLNPYVTIQENFDDLLIPEAHPSRKPTDTFYLSNEICLRTHTSAHQTALLKKGYEKFLVCGDVYRRDEIDRNHYPIFHQMEGLKLFDKRDQVNIIDELKKDLVGLISVLFPTYQYKIVDSYFPFTEPSFEIEILYNEKWLEVLGCGVIHPTILKNVGLETKIGYAFGLGLERLAMVLFKIPDIRYFWSQDERFTNQFSDGKIHDFKMYSNYPICYKDISFWADPLIYNHNDFYDMIREISGDLVENIKIIDEFKKDNRISYCYRIEYRSNDRSLTNEEVNRIQNELRVIIPNKLNMSLR